jgi:hypothetical protein
MSEPGFTRKGRLTAICMLICAVVMVGLVLAGVRAVAGGSHRRKMIRRRFTLFRALSARNRP